MTPARRSRHLRLGELGRMHGIQLAYADVFGRRKIADEETIEALLRARGVDASTERRIERAIAARRAATEKRLVEPVCIVGAERAGRVMLRHTEPRARWQLSTEEGGLLEGMVAAGRSIALPPLPAGYHRLAIEAGRRRHETLVLAAPRSAWSDDERTTGVFAPTYALRSERDFGVGDLGTATELVDWIARCGGKVFGTLPLLSAWLDDPLDPSPYSPVSRLFWNELMLDLDAIPELAASPRARALRRGMERERRELSTQHLIDYRRVAAMKRVLLETLAAEFDDVATAERRAAFRDFCREGEVLEYARFRAETEARGATWPSWRGEAGPPDDERVRYHLFAQWLTAGQVARFSEHARARGVTLYLDFPLGSTPDGYDVWRHGDLFLTGISAGAPPDHSYRNGQNWGFRPFDPEAIRASGYAFFRQALALQLRHAGMLRIDHVMGLHRLYCIPDGFPPTRGAYVRYRAEEFYAVLKIESQRHRATIVGEDLGTVPQYVRSAIDDHGLRRLFVLQRHVTHGTLSSSTIEPAMLASVNNHDIATFGGFVAHRDIDDRHDLGIYDDAMARQQHERRAEVLKKLRAGEGSPRRTLQLLARLHAMLARSRAFSVLVTLEDLWLEPEPQNTPTTTTQRPNWRRRLRLGVEQIARSRALASALRAIVRARESSTNGRKRGTSIAARVSQRRSKQRRRTRSSS